MVCRRPRLVGVSCASMDRVWLRMPGVTMLPAVPDVAVEGSMDDFQIGYVAEDGTWRRVTARKGQRHLPGRWWSATDGGHVGYESWLERDHVMWLDFDARVVGIASQPFRLSWTTVAGRVRSHVPDYFARRTDGSAVVVDCRPVDRRPAQDVAAFEVTRRVCDLLGWRYRLVGAVNVIATANLRWLAGYRHPRHGMAGLTEALRVAFPGPTPLMSGAEAVGDPIAVLPVLFHLLWRHELVTDLSVPLHPDATVTSVVAA